MDINGTVWTDVERFGFDLTFRERKAMRLTPDDDAFIPIVI